MSRGKAQNVPFGFVELPAGRSQQKPRRTGLTMVADFGLPYMQAEDMVTMAGRYIDLAKIAVGTSRLYDLAYLRKKLALYRKHNTQSMSNPLFAVAIETGGLSSELIFLLFFLRVLRGEALKH